MKIENIFNKLKEIGDRHFFFLSVTSSACFVMWALQKCSDWERKFGAVMLWLMLAGFLYSHSKH